MSVAEILRILTIFMGVLILSLDFYNYAKKNLTDSLSMAWGIFSVLVIAVGIFPELWVWSNIRNERIFIFFALLILAIILCVIFISVTVSRIQMKNQELAIHISLQNEETNRIIQELMILTGKEDREL